MVILVYLENTPKITLVSDSEYCGALPPSEVTTTFLAKNTLEFLDKFSDFLPVIAFQSPSTCT